MTIWYWYKTTQRRSSHVCSRDLTAITMFRISRNNNIILYNAILMIQNRNKQMISEPPFWGMYVCSRILRSDVFCTRLKVGESTTKKKEIEYNRVVREVASVFKHLMSYHMGKLSVLETWTMSR